VLLYFFFCLLKDFSVGWCSIAVVFCILLYSAQDPQCFCNLWLYFSSAFCKILGCYHFKYSSASFSPLVQETQLHMWHMYVQTCSIFFSRAWESNLFLLCFNPFIFFQPHFQFIKSPISSVMSNVLKPSTQFWNSAFYFNSRISFVLTCSSLLQFFPF